MNIKHVIFNTSAQIIGRVASGFFSFLSLLIIAKALGSEFFGEYTKAITIVSFFYIISDFGLNTIFLRDHHKHWQQKFPYFLGARLVISILLMLVAALVMLGMSRFLPGFPLLVTMTTLIASISLIGQSTALSIQAIFQQTKRLDKAAYAQITGSALNTFLLFIFFKNIQTNPQSGVLITALILSASSLVSAFIAFSMLKSFGKFLPRIDIQFWKKIWINSLPLGLTLIFNIVYFRVDTFILSSTRSSAEVGIYGLAYKFFEVALILPTFIMNSVYPDLLLIKNNQQKFWQKSKQIIIVFAAMSLVILSIGWIGAPLIALVKSDFNSSIYLLRILLIGLPLFYLTSPMMWFLIMWGKQWHLSLIYAASLIFNFVCNLIFIPIYGSTAAAIITIVTEAVVLFLQIYIFLKIIWKKTS